MKCLSCIVVIITLGLLLLAGCTTEKSHPAVSEEHLAKAKAAYEKAIVEEEISHDALISADEEALVSVIGTEIGNVAPDFTVTSTDGREISLSEFKEQDKPVLVYFMSTWCPYCAKDFETLSALYEPYKEKVPVVVISLDLSEDSTLLAEYKKKYPALESIPFTPGKVEILTSYNAVKTTSKYAVSPQGRIIYTGSSDFTPGQWTTLLDMLENS